MDWLRLEDICNDVHLRVKDAGRGLNNADGLVGGLDLEDLVRAVGDDGHDVEADVLGVHVEGERVRQGLLLAGGDGGLVLDGAEVAQDAGGRVRVGGELLQRVQGAAQEHDLDGLGLVVGDVHHGLGRAAVDELHAEDVGLGEGGGDIGLQLDRGRATGIGIERLQGTAKRSQSQRAVVWHVDVGTQGITRAQCDQALEASALGLGGRCLAGGRLTDSPWAKTETTRRANAARTEYWRATMMDEIPAMKGGKGDGKREKEAIGIEECGEVSCSSLFSCWSSLYPGN